MAAVECCYGAELYDSVTLSLPMPICQRYLIQGAYGYFGSSTIAYGPEEGNGAADLITQYFLLAMLDGASLGRAALWPGSDLFSRLRSSIRGFEDTWAVQPARRSFDSSGGDHQCDKRPEGRRRRSEQSPGAARTARQAARRWRVLAGDQTDCFAQRQAKFASRAAVQKALANIAREAGIGARKDFTAFDVKDAERCAPARQQGGAGGIPLLRRCLSAKSVTRRRESQRRGRGQGGQRPHRRLSDLHGKVVGK